MSRPYRLGLSKIGLAGLLSMLGAACSTITYESNRYGGVPTTQVHLACHDTYEVYDRPDAGTFLVLTNPLNENLGLICDEGATALARDERMRRVARIFLDESSNRPACTITRETPLLPMQTEFSYRCPVPGAPVTPVRTSKRRPRG
jgi:hypothetical protein